MECFKRFTNIDSHFASKQILKDFERSNHRRVKGQTIGGLNGVCKGKGSTRTCTVRIPCKCTILSQSEQTFSVCIVLASNTFDCLLDALFVKWMPCLLNGRPVC